MGTVELTGFEMTRICAVGATRPMALARSRTIEAFVWHASVPTHKKDSQTGTHVEKIVARHLESLSAQPMGVRKTSTYARLQNGA